MKVIVKKDDTVQINMIVDELAVIGALVITGMVALKQEGTSDPEIESIGPAFYRACLEPEREDDIQSGDNDGRGEVLPSVGDCGGNSISGDDEQIQGAPQDKAVSS